ncbi:MAG: ArsR/SmtB family transcription factor [Candidatus Bathyarchaeia archaeon]
MSVCIVDDPDKIRLLADFTRAEILQLLCEYPMTEAQLSDELGLTRAAVGYHLNLLKKAQLIYLEKVEPEEHGILQKFYSPVAAFFIVDYDRIPNDAKRYFIQTQIIHLRGIFTAFQLNHHFPGVSPTTLEKLAVALLKQLENTGRKHAEKGPVENAETLKVKIYAEALESLMKQDEWHALFKKSENLGSRR